MVAGRSLGLGGSSGTNATNGQSNSTSGFWWPGLAESVAGWVGQARWVGSARLESTEPDLEIKISRYVTPTRNPSRDSAALSNMSSEEIQALENQLAQDGKLDGATQADLMQRREATIYVSTIRRNNQVIVRTGDTRSMDQIAALVTQLDVPTPTVLLEVKVLRVILADGFNSAFEYFGGSGKAATAMSDGSLSPAFQGASTVSP